MRDTSPQYYYNLWETLEIIPKYLDEVEWFCNKMFENESIYAGIQDKTNVNKWVIAAIHGRESSFSFKCNLANGDPLGRPTVNYPPNKLWFTWEESAIDILTGDQKEIIPEEFNVASASLMIEQWNGMGFASRDKNSAYLYSFSNHGLNVGNFVSDGHYDKNAICQQVGAITALKRAAELTDLFI